MAITRRQFIRRSGVVTAGSLLGPSLFNHFLLRKALADIETRYFVVLFLDGGNDGLNTVTPVNDGGATLRQAYDAARATGNGGLNLSPGDLGGTLIGTDPGSGAQLALHPGFYGLKQLYDAGHVAVIQGCGYPEYNLSHEESRAIWQNADPLRTGYGLGTGWVGRYLANNYAGTEIPGVNFQNSIAGEFVQTATSVLTLDRLRDFGFPYDEFNYGSDQPLKRQAFLDLCTAASANAQSTLHYIGDSGNATLTASESYGVNPATDECQLHENYIADRLAWNDAYAALNYGNGYSTARNLREIAKVIYGVESGVPNVNARFFQLSNGGYDTHSDQGASGTNDQHYGLHQEVGNSLKVFYDDMADMGVADRVTVLVWSEFSRRIPQNDNGTDHGSQGPMFVIGGSVNGGVYGKHPNINDSALDSEGNTVYTQGPTSTAFRSTDFRDVYGTIFRRWLKLTQAEAAALLPPDSGSATYYWVTPNFDMGFLPVLP